MRYLVEALDTYQKMDLTDKGLGRKPLTGEIFEVSKERLDVLLGKNDYNVPFVRLIEEKKQIEETKTEKPIKRTKKKITK